MAAPVKEPGLYLIPSVSIHTFIASMIGRASSWRFCLRSSYDMTDGFVTDVLFYRYAVSESVHVGPSPVFIQSLLKMTTYMHQTVWAAARRGWPWRLFHNLQNRHIEDIPWSYIDLPGIRWPLRPVSLRRNEKMTSLSMTDLTIRDIPCRPCAFPCWWPGTVVSSTCT